MIFLRDTYYPGVSPALTVNYTLSGSTAVDGTDYTATWPILNGWRYSGGRRQRDIWFNPIDRGQPGPEPDPDNFLAAGEQV